MMVLSPLGDGIASLQPDSNGISSSVVGAFKPGEHVIFPDDNQHHNPALPVLAYNMLSPRLNGSAELIIRHERLFDSNDLGSAAFDNSNSDDQHPMAMTINTGATVPSHIFFLPGVGNPHLFSAISHAMIADAIFMMPILSDGTNTHYWRHGYANVPFGSTTHGAYFEFDSNANAQGVLVTAAAGVKTSVPTGVVIAAGTWYRVLVVVTNNTRADLYIAIEGTPLPSTPSCSSTTNIPSGIGQAMAPMCGLEKTAGPLSRAIVFSYFLPYVDRLRA